MVAAQTTCTDVQISSVFICQRKGFPYIGIGSLENRADIADHTHSTDGLEIHQEVIAHGSVCTAEELSRQAFADNDKTAQHPVIAVSETAEFIACYFKGSAGRIILGTSKGPSGHEVVAEIVEPIGRHGAQEDRAAVGRGRQGAHRFPQTAVPGQAVHARQTVIECMEGGRPQPLIAHAVGAVVAHDERTVVVHRAAAPSLRRHVGRAEVIDHHHHHDKGHSDSRTDDTHRRVEAVLPDKIEQLFHRKIYLYLISYLLYMGHEYPR